MNTKTCPFCSNRTCIRKGRQEGHQRWQCKNCKKKFQGNHEASVDIQELFCLYAFNKQTLRELALEYHKHTSVFQELFDTLVFKEKIHTPRIIALCVDATFFEDFGVVVFRDQKQKENLWWKFIEEERLEYYKEGKQYLESLGYTITSVTADGLPGLPSIFKDIPFQFCHFHARKNITKYITRRPKTAAGIQLQYIMHDLKHFTHESFRATLKKWHEQQGSFLKEKTVHPDGSWSYTHRKLRSAIRSMLHMSGYLFTYQTRTDIYIPPTTNTLEGHFTHLKIRVACHRSISTKRKQKIVFAILFASSAEYKKDLKQRLF
jgi:hypothetical protein